MCISDVVGLTSVVARWQQQAGNSSSVHSGCSHFLLSIDSCFTVWDSQLRPLRLMTQGKNWACITVFLTENRSVGTEYFTKPVNINKICLNRNQLVFHFQWCFQLVKHVSYHYALGDLQVNGRKRWSFLENGHSLTCLKFWIKSRQYKVEVIKTLGACQIIFFNMNISLHKWYYWNLPHNIDLLFSFSAVWNSNIFCLYLGTVTQTKNIWKSVILLLLITHTCHF